MINPVSSLSCAIGWLPACKSIVPFGESIIGALAVEVSITISFELPLLLM